MDVSEIKKRIEFMQAENKLLKIKIDMGKSVSYSKKRIYQNKNTIDVFKDYIAEASRAVEPNHVSNLFVENTRLHHTILNRLKQTNINTIEQLMTIHPNQIFGANSKALAEIVRLYPKDSPHEGIHSNKQPD